MNSNGTTRPDAKPKQNNDLATATGHHPGRLRASFEALQRPIEPAVRFIADTGWQQL